MHPPLIFCKGHYVHIYYPSEENSHLICSEPKCAIAAPQEVKACVLGTTVGTRFFLLCTQNCVSYVDEKSLFRTCNRNEANASSQGNLPDGNCIFNQLLPEHMNNEEGLETNVTSAYKSGEKDRVYFCPSSDIISININLDLIFITMRFDNSEKKQYCINVFKVGHAGVEKTLFEKIPEKKIKFAVKESKSSDAEDKPLLCIITSSKFMSAKSNDNVILPHELYVVLFSKAFELSASPVLLFCDNNGCVFYILLKERCESGYTPQHVLCDIGSSVVGIHCVQIYFVKNFITEDSSNEIQLYDEDHAENSPALAVISQNGTVVLFMVLNSKKAIYTVHISGPIVCSVQGNILYHSNGKNIFSTKFYYDKSKKQVYVKSTMVKDVSVIQMEIITNNCQDDYDSLLCRMKTGEMICVPTFSTTPLTTSKCLKDLLYCADQDRYTLTKLSEHHRYLNDIIEQINISARLLNIYLSPNTPPLLVTDVKIQNAIEGMSHRHFLCLRIFNHTKMIISTDWSVVLYFIRGDSSKSICHSHKLSSLWKPEKCVNIRLPITEDINDVEIFLGYYKVVDTYVSRHIPICIHIPLVKYELNVLDFLLDEEVFNQMQHSNSACATKEIEAQIHTTQILISTIHTQTIIKGNKHANSSDILKYLLRNHAEDEICVNNSLVKLRNTSGSIIFISINLKDEVRTYKENEYVIKLQSENCALLACVRSAVLRMVQKHLPGVIHSTDSRSQQYVNQLKETKSHLEKIMVKIHKFKPEEILSEISQVYGQLRQIHV